MKKNRLLAHLAAAAVTLPAFGQGADVSLCIIQGLTNWGTVAGSGIRAYSIGTTSVNYGTVNLNWIQNGTNHPVISMNMFQLKDGRFQQVGQSWLKHSFCALQIDSACSAGPNCPNQGGCLSFLAPGCQDPYTSDRNGGQTLLGPKWQVNPHEGTFNWPYDQSGQAGSAIFKRLQVHETDVNIAQNGGGLYFVEGQYVARDDALAGNQDNNASYRMIQILGAAPYTASFVAGQTTVFQRSAIFAWRTHGLGINMVDPDVILQNVPVLNDGQFIAGYKVSDNLDGTWHYEYAINNMNVHRAARQVIVPIGANVTVSNVGFHDVDYHSGDGAIGGNEAVNVNYDGTDWAIATGSGQVSWSTQTEAESTLANALRWGTLYNYRFDADSAPQPVSVTIGLYRAGGGGDPDSVTFNGVGPSDVAQPCPYDLDDDGVVGITDLLQLLAEWGAPWGINDLLDLLATWGKC